GGDVRGTRPDRRRAAPERATQRQVEGMVRDDGIGLATRMPHITGPGIVPWVLHHVRPYRVELDIPHACQEVRLGLHQARPVAPFPQRPSALVCRINVVDIPTPNGLHDLGNTVRALWRHEQVDVIGHQDIRLHRSSVPRCGLMETRQIEAIIVLMKEDGLPIMPALDDVLRDPWQGIAGQSGHPTPPDGWHRLRWHGSYQESLAGWARKFQSDPNGIKIVPMHCSRDS